MKQLAIGTKVKLRDDLKFPSKHATRDTTKGKAYLTVELQANQFANIDDMAEATSIIDDKGCLVTIFTTDFIVVE